MWITQPFIFTPAVLRSEWTANGGELANHRCGVNVASLCERGYLLLLIVLDLDWKLCRDSALSHHETVRGSECHDFSFDTCVVTALIFCNMDTQNVGNSSWVIDWCWAAAADDDDEVYLSALPGILHSVSSTAPSSPPPPSHSGCTAAQRNQSESSSDQSAGLYVQHVSHYLLWQIHLYCQRDLALTQFWLNMKDLCLSWINAVVIDW